jgi:hypothetical protein
MAFVSDCLNPNNNNTYEYNVGLFQQASMLLLTVWNVTGGFAGPCCVQSSTLIH